MKHAGLKKAAIIAIAVGALLGAPAAAQASSPVATTYGPPATGGVDNPNVGPGGTFAFTAPVASFIPGEPVSVSLTGENASGATLAFVKFAVETALLGVIPAAADGGLGSASITLPANSSGSYTVLATSPSNPSGVSVSVSGGDTTGGGASADGGTGTANGGTGTGASGDSDSSGLAATGSDSEALLTLWVAGGALALVGGGIAVASTVRRNGKGHAAA